MRILATYTKAETDCKNIASDMKEDPTVQLFRGKRRVWVIFAAVFTLPDGKT